MRVDLHMHSRYSPDSYTSLDDLVARARQVGLDRIALTDHNVVEGALELRRREPELAIVGEEVKTREGEIIALFIDAPIAWGGRPEDVMDMIHAAGGLCLVAHPFDRWRASFSPHRLADLSERIDLIEVYNQWTGDEANRAAERLAAELGKPGTSGSDAHSPRELGHCWMEMEDFDGPDAFLASVAGARRVRTELSGTQRRA